METPSLRVGTRGKTGRGEGRGVARKLQKHVPIHGLESIQEGNDDSKAGVYKPGSRGL